MNRNPITIPTPLESQSDRNTQFTWLKKSWINFCPVPSNEYQYLASQQLQIILNVFLNTFAKSIILNLI